MKHTVTLVFDNESQNKINNIRKMLNENNVNSEFVINHISIAGYINELDNYLIEKINDYFIYLKPIELNIISINVFQDEKNIIYLEFDESKELIKLQKDFLNYMKQYNLKLKKYYNGNWIPHSTIAIGISNKEMYNGYNILKDKIEFPINVKIDRIEIL